MRDEFSCIAQSEHKLFIITMHLTTDTLHNKKFRIIIYEESEY